MILDKFLAPYINFIDQNFGREEHHYVFITSQKYEYGLTPEHKAEFLHTDDDIFITLLDYMKMAKKIILHGLWRDKVDILLYFNQKLLKKCYWIMWGGDFYFPETKNKIRYEVIKNMGWYVSSTKNDIFYIQEKYNIKVINVFFSQFYPSCISDFEITLHQKKNSTIKILVGNSATNTNRHTEIFDILSFYKEKNIEVIVPLNYGNNNYKQEILEIGNLAFGNKFKPIVDFMDFDDYKKLLSSIDIGIFNNNRQQAGANIKLLAGYGKKLYISKENSFYQELKENNIFIYEIDNFNIEKINPFIAENNIIKAKYYYSFESLLNSWRNIFNV